MPDSQDTGVDGPTTEPDPFLHRRPLENEVPVPVAFRAVIATGDRVAVYLCGLTVYSHGFDFTLEIRAQESTRDGRLSSALHDGGRDQLLIGLEYADGRRGTSLGWHRFIDDEAAVVLMAGGGGGSSRSANASMFVSPLPPAGRTRLICAWPQQGINDTTVDLPTDDILAAAQQVTQLWPWTPERQEWPESTRPDVPPGSWFASALPQPK